MSNFLINNCFREKKNHLKPFINCKIENAYKDCKMNAEGSSSSSSNDEF